MSWPEVKLEDLVDVNPPAVFVDENIVSFIPMQSVSDTEKRIVELQTRPLVEVAKGYTQFKNGDLLLAKITPCFENGKQAIVEMPTSVGYGSTEFHVFRKKDDQIDIRFLHYFFQQPSFRHAAAINMTGTAGQKRVPAGFLARLKIPLPPLEVQKKIAAVLEKADTLRRKREEQIKRLDDLLQATFLDMFGDPVTNPKGWNTDTLGSLSNSITDGKHGDCNNDNNSGYFFISAKDIHDGMIDYSKARQIVKKEFEEVHRRTNLQVNDLVIVNTGSIGKMAIVKPDPRTRQTTFQKSVAIVKPKHEILNVYYLKTLFEIVLKDIVNASSGSTLKNLLLSRMRELTLLVPPVHFQREYEDFVLKSNKILDALTKSLQRQEHLFNSLMQRAFKGELELK